MLPGLGERRLDHDVVERDRGGQARQRRVRAQLVRHPVEPVEHLPEAPRELWPDRFQSAADGAVTEVAHLVHEAVEEDGVARLVDLLRGEEVLLLLGRRGVDVRRQPVGDGVLAPEEERVVPQRGAALELGHLLVPLAAVLGEVDLRRAPVALLPACVQVRVADLLRDGRHHVTHPLVCLYRRVGQMYQTRGSQGDAAVAPRGDRAARGDPARRRRADRRAGPGRPHAPRRRRARGRVAVRHDLLVLLQGGDLPRGRRAGRRRGGRAPRAPRARPGAAEPDPRGLGPGAVRRPRGRRPAAIPPSRWRCTSSCSRPRASRTLRDEVARWETGAPAPRRGRAARGRLGGPRDRRAHRRGGRLGPDARACSRTRTRRSSAT